ncbi:TPA: hypothetical protein PAP86_004248 [Salmonella enterica]|nr:hypothetical protein [Salmonella enterica]EKF3857567.1 hypothetical protein [Salmonella enterica]HDD2123950.1 hypothetical protein [Salmonella enterica]
MKVLSSLCYTVVVTSLDSLIMSQRRKVHSDSLAGQLDLLISRLVQKSGGQSRSRRQIYGFRVYILDISEEMRVFCRKKKISIGYARFMETEFRGEKDLLIVFVKRFFPAMQENEVSIYYLYDTEICE